MFQKNWRHSDDDEPIPGMNDLIKDVTDHLEDNPFGLSELKGIPWPMPKGFAVGDAVTYSVYPHVANGLGMATRQGILSVGSTYMEVTAAGLGDICQWRDADLVSHRSRYS